MVDKLIVDDDALLEMVTDAGLPESAEPLNGYVSLRELATARAEERRVELVRRYDEELDGCYEQFCSEEDAKMLQPLMTLRCLFEFVAERKSYYERARRSLCSLRLMAAGVDGDDLPALFALLELLPNCTLVVVPCSRLNVKELHALAENTKNVRFVVGGARALESEDGMRTFLSQDEAVLQRLPLFLPQHVTQTHLCLLGQKLGEVHASKKPPLVGGDFDAASDLPKDPNSLTRKFLRCLCASFPEVSMDTRHQWLMDLCL